MLGAVRWERPQRFLSNVLTLPGQIMNSFYIILQNISSDGHKA